MKNVILLVFLLTTMLALFSCSSPDAELTVEATSADLPKGDTLFLAGNLPVLGAWRPDGLAMVREGDVWRASFRVPKGERVEYKFTRGSWAKEATTEEGHVPTNHVIERVASDTLAKHDIANWKDQFFRPFGGVTGKVEHLANITPKGLTARNVWVWLPPDYEKNPNERYPVLYAHDAQNIFDPSTSTLGRDWQMDETADSLIRAGLVAPLIIVGVDCYPPKRTDEYSETELGNLYQDFMCCQLKPMIDSLYRTKADAKHTAVIGASMGGLVSFILAWERPDVFGHAGCMSPAFQIRDIDYVKYVKPDKQPKRDIDLYIDNGTVGLEAQLQPGCDAMMAALKDKGYPFVWVKDEGAEHNEIAWSKRFHRPLLQFFGR